MNQTDIIYPVLVQVFLTIGILMMLLFARRRSLESQGKSLQDISLNRTEDWDEQSTKLSNNLRNQFEVPVLFYAAASFALHLTVVDYLLLLLAWVFVLSRIVHAFIHIGPNVVASRVVAYGVGVTAVSIMWIVIAVRFITAGA